MHLILQHPPRAHLASLSAISGANVPDFQRRPFKSLQSRSEPDTNLRPTEKLMIKGANQFTVLAFQAYRVLYPLLSLGSVATTRRSY